MRSAGLGALCLSALCCLLSRTAFVGLQPAASRGGTAARALGQGEAEKLRLDLEGARQREATINFRMSTAEQEERRLASQLSRLEEERSQVAAKLRELEEQVARAEAKAAAKVAEIMRLAEEERKRAVAQVWQEAEARIPGTPQSRAQAAVLAMLLEVEATQAATSNAWFPHVMDDSSFQGGYTPW